MKYFALFVIFCSKVTIVLYLRITFSTDRLQSTLADDYRHFCILFHKKRNVPSIQTHSFKTINLLN